MLSKQVGVEVIERVGLVRRVGAQQLPWTPAFPERVLGAGGRAVGEGGFSRGTVTRSSVSGPSGESWLHRDRLLRLHPTTAVMNPVGGRGPRKSHTESWALPEGFRAAWWLRRSPNTLPGQTDLTCLLSPGGQSDSAKMGGASGAPLLAPVP